jgi:hypothetical protein
MGFRYHLIGCNCPKIYIGFAFPEFPLGSLGLALNELHQTVQVESDQENTAQVGTVHSSVVLKKIPLCQKVTDSCAILHESKTRQAAAARARNQ